MHNPAIHPTLTQSKPRLTHAARIAASPLSRFAMRLFNAITVVAFLAFVLIAYWSPEDFDALCAKDSFVHTGLVEHLTVAVLVPGIVAACVGLVLWRRRYPSCWIVGWHSAWTAACIYFAGEECSWGQWYFGYGTPAPIEIINDQHEMNLHNMSSWLDQKPRTIVELFIITAGFLLPAIRCVLRRWAELRKTPPRAEPNHTAFWDWILAPPMCWAAGCVVLVQRLAELIDDPFLQRIGDSEFRELGIAWFLGLYLISYSIRIGLMAQRLNDAGTDGNSAEPGAS